MLGSQTYAALLPQLRDEWAISNAQAGVVGGMFFAGYIATVSYWTALTDRVDARKVYLAGGLLAAAGGVGFGWGVSGFATAILFMAMLGGCISAAYMSGMLIHLVRLSGSPHRLCIVYNTMSYG